MGGQALRGTAKQSEEIMQEKSDTVADGSNQRKATC